MRKPRLLFFGNERLATGVTSPALVLQALLAAGYDVAAIVVAQEDAGKSRKERPLEVAAIAEAQGIEILAPSKLKEARAKLEAYGAVAAVLVAYGKIVPQEIIDIFPKGIINIHPSLLPLHRGPTPLESVILQGDKETGVSLMQLAAKMDAGPVYSQQPVPLSGKESKQQLADQLLQIGSTMLIRQLPYILDGSLTPQEQDDTLATYDNKIDKQAAELDWNKPAVQLEREVRAYAGWPRSRTTLGTHPIIVTKAHTTTGSGTPGTMWLEQLGGLGLYTSDGVFVIDALILPGKKEMPATAFLAGYKIL